jgi:hypothetical protein
MAPKSFYDKGVELSKLLPQIADPLLQEITKEAIREYYQADISLERRIDPLRKPIVISLHGVMTRGKWQKDLTPTLNDSGITHIPLDYGFFLALLFVLPSLRLRKVRWFLDQYTHITEKYPDQNPSMIAHSFGTYIIARVMELYPEIKFDQIILCGSIVRRDYGWTGRHTYKQMNRVLNECGCRDWVVRISAWAAKDANPSGVYGFLAFMVFWTRVEVRFING